jgi:hypothetical protein
VTQGKKFPKDAINEWPEVFGEISLNVIPLRYLLNVKINFKNSKQWEINLQNNLTESSWEEFEISLRDMLASYESEIENVDFQLDTDRIKKDIIKHTNKFLKKRKLK